MNVFRTVLLCGAGVGKDGGTFSLCVRRLNGTCSLLLRPSSLLVSSWMGSAMSVNGRKRMQFHSFIPQYWSQKSTFRSQSEQNTQDSLPGITRVLSKRRASHKLPNFCPMTRCQLASIQQVSEKDWLSAGLPGRQQIHLI